MRNAWVILFFSLDNRPPMMTLYLRLIIFCALYSLLTNSVRYVMYAQACANVNCELYTHMMSRYFVHTVSFCVEVSVVFIYTLDDILTSQIATYITV